jgi:hypothetical protein
MGEQRLMSKKKPSFPVNERLEKYLIRYDRSTEIPVFYEDLLRFSGSVSVYDKHDEDTLWVRCWYPEFEREEIDYSLKKIYTILHSDGRSQGFDHLNVDAIDFCTFGNSKPFRIKVRNILNDNFTYFYVKKADASRVYGLEFEHILSPNRINFLVYKDTLIEEHIVGIPGDEFIKEKLDECTTSEKAQIAKQFVKFNERCMLRLLGDMRSYNYVVIPTHDFDRVEYKIRAIDFDQQNYEGRLNVYRPQFFKENYKMVQIVEKHLEESSILQYKKEERSQVAKRLLVSEKRFRRLIRCMMKDTISIPENVNRLKTELFEYTKDVNFKHSKTMGEVLKSALSFVKRNYFEYEKFRAF